MLTAISGGLLAPIMSQSGHARAQVCSSECLCLEGQCDVGHLSTGGEHPNPAGLSEQDSSEFDRLDCVRESSAHNTHSPPASSAAKRWDPEGGG